MPCLMGGEGRGARGAPAASIGLDCEPCTLLHRYAEFALTRPSPSRLVGTCMRAPSLHVRYDKQQQQEAPGRVPTCTTYINLSNPQIRKLANSTARENPQSDSTSTVPPLDRTPPQHYWQLVSGSPPLRRQPHPHCPNLLFAVVLKLKPRALASRLDLCKCRQFPDHGSRMVDAIYVCNHVVGTHMLHVQVARPRCISFAARAFNRVSHGEPAYHLRLSYNLARIDCTCCLNRQWPTSQC